MIRTQDRTPFVYSRDSRDYQLLGKLFDATFNLNKTSIDSMINLRDPSSIDYRVVDLACKTIGFDYKNRYPNNELVGIISSFKDLIKNKGTSKAILDSIKLLLNTQNIKHEYYIGGSGFFNNKEKHLDIYLPEETNNSGLLEELLDYVLPAGWTFSIMLKSNTTIDFDDNSSIRIVTRDQIRKKYGSIFDINVSNYFKGVNTIEDLTYIGQVPANSGDKMISPLANIETVIKSK